MSALSFGVWPQSQQWISDAGHDYIAVLANCGCTYDGRAGAADLTSNTFPGIATFTFEDKSQTHTVL